MNPETSTEIAVAEAPNLPEKVSTSTFYGPGFNGRFMRVGESQKHLQAFKDFYLGIKRQNMKYSRTRAVRDFNETIAPDLFYPYPTQLRKWAEKWEVEFEVALKDERKEAKQRQRVGRLIAIKDNDEKLVRSPGEIELDMGARTLGGMLINDAVETLQSDDDDLTPDMRVKQKAYALNVFAQVNKMVHGEKELKLKRSAENREDANFLMGLMNKAAAGELSATELETLHASLEKPVVIQAEVIETEDAI